MMGAIVPLPLKRDVSPALTNLDAQAAPLLVEGQAPTLSIARLDAILTKFRGQRTNLAAVLADLETRAPSGDARIEVVNADLRDGARVGLNQIDDFIRKAEECRMASK